MSLLNIPPQLKHVATLLNLHVQKTMLKTACSKLRYKTNHSKTLYKILVSLMFVNTKVKNNLHSNIRRAKTVSVHHR